MKTNQIKLLSIVAFVLGIFVLLTFQNNITKVKADDNPTEAFYKKNCVMCHKTDATKGFDATKTDADLEKIILEGKDVKPIKMPEYKSKGIDEAKAKELVAYMREKAKAATPPATTANTNTQR